MNDLPRPGLEQTGMGEIAHNLLTGTLRRTTKTDVPRGEGRKEGTPPRNQRSPSLRVRAAHQAINFSRLVAKKGRKGRAENGRLESEF